MLSYYIYYRVQPEHSTAAAAAVQHIQGEIATCCGVTGRLLKKRDEPNLWMEVYENIASSAAFEASLKQTEDQSGIAQYLAGNGRRQVECFEA